MLMRRGKPDKAQSTLFQPRDRGSVSEKYCARFDPERSAPRCFHEEVEANTGVMKNYLLESHGVLTLP
jgi:hypothetical protein